jgi:small nuclear ribonucleoprotein (snRNP)-like protein
VTSAKHKCDFVIEQFKDDTFVDFILSVSSEGRLLVGKKYERQLHIYNAEYSHVISINLLDDDKLGDAVWTPRGHIVYAALNNENVVVMTRNGEAIAQTNKSAPSRFYVSPDDVIYLAEFETGVSQSANDGVTWSHVFKATDNWKCVQVVKVSGDSNTETFWTLNRLNEEDDDDENDDNEDDYRHPHYEDDNDDWRLRMYTVDKQRVSNNVTWRDVILPSHVTVDLSCSKLTYDGHTNIFLTDWIKEVVHVWSVSGQYVCQLLPSQLFASNTHPQQVAVVPCGTRIYVGQTEGIVGVFELEYKLL